MTQMPRRPRASRQDGPRGNRFHPPFPMAHQHRRSQEGTLNVGKIRLFTALVALVALAGAIGYGTRTAEAAITGAAKLCTRTSATAASCTLTVTGSVTAPALTDTITVTLSSSPAGATFASVLFGTPSGTCGPTLVAPAFTATTVSFTVTCGGSGDYTVTITETVNITSAATTLTQVASDGTTTFTAAASVPAPAAATASKSCTATGVTSASCTLSVVLPSPFNTGSTTVTVALTGPSGATLTLTGASLTPSSCGTAVVTGAGTITINASAPCTGLTVTETVSGLAAGASSTVSQSVTLTGANTGSATASATVTTTAPTFSITCTSTPGAPPLTSFTALVNTFVPAAPATPLAAVGVVPSTVFCNVNLVALDPGVVEISSVNGLLVSSSGTLTTNLRVPCGTTGVAGSCTGTISFSVAAGGVGIVTVQARYEPATGFTSPERETSAAIVFVAPSVQLTLSLNPNPVAVGKTGTASLTFLVAVSCAPGTATAVAGAPSLVGACVDVSTGTIINAVPSSSVLSGTVVFSIDNAAIARWTGNPVAGDVITTPPPAGAPPSATGFTASPNQVAVRCGFFPTTPLPSATTIGAFFPVPSLSAFFGGCTSVRAEYMGVSPGAVTVNAQFIPDLPGAFANVPGTGVPPQLQALFGFVGATNITVTRTLEVVGVTPTGGVDLARGCNNVSPTVTEAAADYAKRVSPAGALVAIWEHQAATNTFRGWSPAAGAPSDLAQVTRLRPIFICVSGPARLDQPAA
jgi:hypothetical protein